MRKLGLSLRGGGCKATLYLGAIKALEENEIAPSMIIGSSGGAYIAGLFAAGLTYDEILNHATHQSLRNHFGRDSIQGKTIISESATISYLKEAVGDLRIEDTELPIHIQVSNLITGEPEVISSGGLAEAMYMSAAMPVITKPFRIGDNLYIDGDITNGYGADFLRDNGADIVIGLTINDRKPVKRGPDDDGVVDRFVDAITLATRRVRKLDQQINPVDILIDDFDDLGLGLLDCEGSADLLEVGYKHTLQRIKEIKSLIQIDNVENS